MNFYDVVTCFGAQNITGLKGVLKDTDIHYAYKGPNDRPGYVLVVFRNPVHGNLQTLEIRANAPERLVQNMNELMSTDLEAGDGLGQFLQEMEIQ